MNKFTKSVMLSGFSLLMFNNYCFAKDNSINFDKTKYEVRTIKVNEQELKVRAYEDIVYVKNPVDIEYQTLNFYVPEDYYESKKINNFNINNAPIFLPNKIGGYMPSKAQKLGLENLQRPENPDKKPKDFEANNDKPKRDSQRGGKRTNSAAVALSKGYIVVIPGARGRTLTNEGVFTGKAPAAIVDLKAVVKYLHFNDKEMPGDANKIISNGTSAGGALSALLGASVNSKDYDSYLKELGAADASDSIFAVSAYCPITNLENADMAYEWMLNKVTEYKKLKMNSMTDFNQQREIEVGNMTDEEIKLSAELKQLFPNYLNSLNLKDEDGKFLTLDKDGNGTFKEYIKKIIIKSAQKALENGVDLSNFDWLKISNNKVSDLDFDGYVKHLGRLKVTPAFDSINLNSPENNLFGTSKIDALHFSSFSQNKSNSKESIANKEIIKMMNPMSYINNDKLPKHWRIRHGEMDSDTSLAISAILALKLKNSGYNVDYFSPWATPHGGDYDLDELFSWMDNITK
jgi:hypothetical protein